jgi:glutamate-1-semialdehyde 2,1-aminomutase
MTLPGLLTLVASLGVVALSPAIWRRLLLSRAKHPSLQGHARLAQRLARLMPFYEYGPARFFESDEAPADIVAKRRAGFARLERLRTVSDSPATALADELEAGLSDLAFVNLYRVPFQYAGYVRAHLKASVCVAESFDVRVRDLDGRVFYDVAGSYGVNLFGYDFYKECIDAGVERVRDLGPLLGAYHPVVADNVRRLKAISGLDEVSFHMSGTEAVMQAVRLARYHTGRSHLVRFSGAYHGWWDDVQPGVGTPRVVHGTYTLRELNDTTLRVLTSRNDIACVLVNPLQGLHPNSAAPADGSLVASDRHAHFDRGAYTAWLRQLREVCTARSIALIFDEVFVGFRLALGGAQEYFGVAADLVTYGKTLGGGLPVGVLCGARRWMKRFRDDRPLDICFARGTFNSHPYVMATMNEFLRRVDEPQIRASYGPSNDLWNRRARSLNDRLRDAGVPVRVENLSSIWTICYTAPSRYNWMLQYYLRAEGLMLSWVGSGRLIFSHNYSEEQFEAVALRFIAAALAMRDDGWWWSGPSVTNRWIRRRVLRELLAARFPWLWPHVSRGLVRHDRVKTLAAQQLERRPAIQDDIVERVREDLRAPDKSRLHVAEEEQLHRASGDGGRTDDQPHQRHVTHEVEPASVWREDSEQRRVEYEQQR